MRWFNLLPPLTRITLIALAVRLVAALCSQGYFAHDDHFLVVEAAQSWADGQDYNYWLPWNQGADARPSGHSFFYVGLHYLLFELLNLLSIDDPKMKMLVVRLLHALWSVAVVRSGYRIARHLGSERTAWQCGLFLSLFFFLPFLAVRQLVEVACIPFLMWGCECLVVRCSGRTTPAPSYSSQSLGTGGETKSGEQPATNNVLLAALFIGMAVNVRFQAIFFALGPGLVFLFRREWRSALAYGAGVLLPIAVVQGSIDMFLWGRPFAEFTEYVRYNVANPDNTGIPSGWYKYLVDLLAVFIPPLSVAVFFGFVLARKRSALAWAGVVCFIAVHSYFVNRQERFLFPVLPLWFTLGWCAWEEWRMRSVFWQAREKWWNGSMRFVWALNLILLVPITLTYSKRSRCEAQYALRDLPWATGLVIEDSYEHEPPQVPLFYWAKWEASLDYVASDTVDIARIIAGQPLATRPNVVLFIGEEELPRRIANMERRLGPLEHITTAEPGLIDRIVFWLNPINRNESIALYRMKGATTDGW